MTFTLGAGDIGVQRGDRCLMQPAALIGLGVVTRDVVVSATEVAALSLLDIAGNRLNLDAVADGNHRVDERFGSVEVSSDEFCHDVAPLGNGTLRDEPADNLHRLLKGLRKRKELASAQVDENLPSIDDNVAGGITLFAYGRLTTSRASHENSNARGFTLWNRRIVEITINFVADVNFERFCFRHDPKLRWVGLISRAITVTRRCAFLSVKQMDQSTVEPTLSKDEELAFARSGARLSRADGPLPRPTVETPGVNTAGPTS